jgi:hypothetical protein
MIRLLNNETFDVQFIFFLLNFNIQTSRHPGESRGPVSLKFFPGFRLSPE